MAASIGIASLPKTSSNPHATKNAATQLLISSVFKDDVLAAKYALDSGADVNVVNNGATPLFIACLRGHEEMTMALVAAGANVNAVNRWKMTPLYFASRQGHQAVVLLLLAAGAVVNIMNKYGETPLFIASQYGRKTVVNMLLAAGAKWVIVPPRNSYRLSSGTLVRNSEPSRPLATPVSQQNQLPPSLPTKCVIM